MSHTITLGFQNNSANAGNPSFFNLELAQDGKKHQLTDLISKATSGGNPVKVPSGFFVSEVLLSKPGQLSSGGSVDIEYPSGSSDHRGVATLNANTTDVKPSAPLKDISVKGSK